MRRFIGGSMNLLFARPTGFTTAGSGTTGPGLKKCGGDGVMKQPQRPGSTLSPI